MKEKIVTELVPPYNRIVTKRIKKNYACFIDRSKTNIAQIEICENNKNLEELKEFRDKLIQKLVNWRVFYMNGEISRFGLTKSTLKDAFKRKIIEVDPELDYIKSFNEYSKYFTAEASFKSDATDIDLMGINFVSYSAIVDALNELNMTNQWIRRVDYEERIKK